MFSELHYQICSVKCIEGATHTLFEQHMKKNTREISHTLPDVCKQIFETFCSTFFFVKTPIFYDGNE